MAGRTPLPSNVHDINGNPGKRKRNAKEPESPFLDDLTPPPHLPAHVAAIWREMAPKLKKAKVLTEMDTMLLELTCTAIANHRLAMEKTADGKVLQRNAETGSVSLSPWMLVQSMTFKQGMAALREWGATPAARSRVMVDPQGDMFGKNPFGAYS